MDTEDFNICTLVINNDMNTGQIDLDALILADVDAVTASDDIRVTGSNTISDLLGSASEEYCATYEEEDHGEHEACNHDT